MASKDGGGGGFFWGVVGFLIGVAATLATLAWFSREPLDRLDPRTAADDAAEQSLDEMPPAVAPPVIAGAPKAAEDRSHLPPRAPDPGIDPATDDQIADDAAASGMTSRPPPPDE